ncbi:hypothetical protein [Ectobacillus funiculus]|uniref:Uncharacterized protein n=1 Tax=Ectobacillus funiculus TaxID=137993 RepID=A0ABV5WGL9_9BACI
MSLVQFDEVYEICCEMADVKVLRTVQPVIPEQDEPYWWEDAVREVLDKKEEKKAEKKEEKKEEKKDIFIMT